MTVRNWAVKVCSLVLFVILVEIPGCNFARPMPVHAQIVGDPPTIPLTEVHVCVVDPLGFFVMNHEWSALTSDGDVTTGHKTNEDGCETVFLPVGITVFEAGTEIRYYHDLKGGQINEVRMLSFAQKMRLPVLYGNTQEANIASGAPKMGQYKFCVYNSKTIVPVLIQEVQYLIMDPLAKFHRGVTLNGCATEYGPQGPIMIILTGEERVWIIEITDQEVVWELFTDIDPYLFPVSTYLTQLISN